MAIFLSKRKSKISSTYIDQDLPGYIMWRFTGYGSIMFYIYLYNLFLLMKEENVANCADDLAT